MLRSRQVNLNYFILTAIVLKYPFLVYVYLPYIYRYPTTHCFNKYYTLRADLLPHSEQVQFIKSGRLGTTKKFLVDLKHLQKININEIEDTWITFNLNHFDHHLCFKDTNSGEVFIMDTMGFWSKKGINHPLINK